MQQHHSCTPEIPSCYQTAEMLHSNTRQWWPAVLQCRNNVQANAQRETSINYMLHMLGSMSITRALQGSPHAADWLPPPLACWLPWPCGAAPHGTAPRQPCSESCPPGSPATGISSVFHQAVPCHTYPWLTCDATIKSALLQLTSACATALQGCNADVAAAAGC